MKTFVAIAILSTLVALPLGLLWSADTHADRDDSEEHVPDIEVTATPTMIAIPLTKFKMGGNPHHDEKVSQALQENRPLSVHRRDMVPKHTVVFTHRFEMGVTEVTQEQWMDVMGNNPSYHQDCGPTCPVEQVSWFDVILYTNRLSAKHGLEPCYVIKGEKVSWPKGYACMGYRLPTESEWEGTARSPTQKTVEDRGPRFVKKYAWTSHNSNETTHPVATRKVDQMGLYDMRGNVWEWTWDRYGRYMPGKRVDPKGAKKSRKNRRRVYRGGSAFNGFEENTRKFRNHWLPAGRDMNIGFRLARTIE